MNYAIASNGQIVKFGIEQPKNTRRIQLRRGTWKKITTKYSARYKWVKPKRTYPKYKNAEV